LGVRNFGKVGIGYFTFDSTTLHNNRYCHTTRGVTRGERGRIGVARGTEERWPPKMFRKYSHFVL